MLPCCTHCISEKIDKNAASALADDDDEDGDELEISRKYWILWFILGNILNPTLQHVSAHCNEQLTFVNSMPNILSFGRCHMSSDRGTS